MRRKSFRRKEYRIFVSYEGQRHIKFEQTTGRVQFGTYKKKLHAKDMKKFEKEIAKELGLKNVVITNYRYF